MDRLDTLAHRAIAVIQMPKLELEKVKDKMFAHSAITVIQMPKLEQEKVKYEIFAGGEV